MKKLMKTTKEMPRRSYSIILADAASRVKKAGFLKPAMDLEIASVDALTSPTVTRESVVHSIYKAIEIIADKGGAETAKGLIDLTFEAYALAC